MRVGGFCDHWKGRCPRGGDEVECNSTHKNRLICLSSGFSHLYALNKGESWINWGSELVLLIENQQKFWFESNTQFF